jgi:hypothetical protein
MKPFFIVILLFFNNLLELKSFGQTIAQSEIRIARLTFLTNNLDSLSRSFIKKGFRLEPGLREPAGVFNNSITLSDGSEMILETTYSQDTDDWRLQDLRKFGNHVAGIAFEVQNMDSLYAGLRNDSLLVTSIMEKDGLKYFALDSCAPLDVVFLAKSNLSSYKTDSLTNHPNGVFRFDWILLSAATPIEKRLRSLFEKINAWKLHQGCSDYWRIGPPSDFCFFRFEQLPPKAGEKNDWLSIEPANIFFAY